MQNIKKDRAGLTLVELILSIAIIGMIAIAFMPLFVMSAKTNSKSETTLDSTYLGKDAMELAYVLSRNISYETLVDELVGKGYSKVSNNEFGYEYSDNKYLNMKFTEEDNLVKVVVKIFKDKDMNQLEVQYESLYSWKERGILSGE